MVSTKRGVRVSFPTKTNAEQLTDVQATPSTGRRTRRAVKPAESPTQHALAETRCQLERTEGGPPESSSVVKKRCTRASRLHSPQQPSTPVGSVHEADTSDLESCCSAVSDVEPSVTRSGSRRGRRPRAVSQEDEDPSEVESCSSAVSASKPVQASRRSTRRRTVPRGSAAADVEVADVEVDSSRRVTRSQRKATRGRSSAKPKTEDSELSDADSCASGTHGAEVSKSTTRRATRSTRETLPIPLHLDEPSEGSRSPSRTSRRTRAARGAAAVAVDASEPPFCDSDGFESGPTYSVTTRRSGKTRSTGPKAADSDSDATVRSPAGSPSPSRGKGTPCSSSRTGSGSSGSGRSAAATRRSVKDCSVVLELGWGRAEEDDSTDDSRLESTVIAKDADRTLLEEEERQTSEELEDANDADLPSGEADAKREGKEADVLSVEGSHASPSVPDGPGRTAGDVGEPAVIVTGQQEELSAEDKDGETSEMEVMQQTFPPSEPVKPCRSVAVTTCEKASEITGEVEEKHEAVDAADADIHPSQEDEPLDEDAVVEMQPSAEEEMEVSRVKSDAQRVVESIQATSSQQHKVTVESDSERQPKDIVVQNAKIISLLDSSDDEDEPDEAGEREVSDEDDLGHAEEEDEEERGGPSSRSTAAAASVEGLFMVDTRPGQDVDEEYYREQPGEEEEATNTEVELEEQDEEFVDEEFVDEEGDDDDDADILFSSRNPQLKEMSSRIDPGIRGKELLGLYISFDGSKSKPVSDSLLKLKEKKMQDEVMKKSVITPDFEKKDAVPPYSESKRAVKLKHRVERDKSTGDGWFNMKAPEMSQELKGDLQVLKMRGSMDPKRFYKKNDREGFPKYFQVGTVVDSAVDFYHSRVPKKQRKRTMVEELLADAEFRHNNKKRYQQIVTEKAAQGAGKRNKKKNKFRKK